MNEQATADLQTALARVQADATANAAQIRTLTAQIAAGQQADDSSQVEDAVTKLNAIADTLEAAGKTDTPPAPAAAATPQPAAA